VKQVVVFSATGPTHEESYDEVVASANEWLVTNSDVTILASHTNMAITPEGQTEFAITLIVETFKSVL
jgi:hypothetical protein